MPIPIFDKFQSAFGGPIIDGNLVDNATLSNTIFVNSGGNDTDSGRTLTDPVATFARALTIAATFTGPKAIICLDNAIYTEEIIVSVSELAIWAPHATVSDVDLSSQATLVRFRACEDINVGFNSRVQIDTCRNVLVSSGAHRLTEINIFEITAGSSINFQTATGVIFVNINDVDNQSPTIPDALTLRGYIGTTIYGTGAGSVAASDVSVDSSTFLGIFNGVANAQDALGRVDATGLGAPITQRSDAAYVATSTNANQWFNREVRGIGAADALKTFTLPNEVAIAAAIAAFPDSRTYPFRITVSYVGGISPLMNLNRLRIIANADGPAITGRNSINLTRGEAVVFEQSVQSATFDVISESNIQGGSSESLTDIELQLGVPWTADDISTLPTLVLTGYAFKVTGAATDGTTVLGELVYNDDWVVFEGTTFVDWTDNTQWFVLAGTDVRRISQASSNFLSEVTETGLRFDLSSNIFINPVNVVIQNYLATGLPYQGFYFTTNTVSPGTARTITYTNTGIQFANLVGGRLTLVISARVETQNGFAPELTDLLLTFGDTTFTFPVTTLDSVSGDATIDIDIPNEDYTDILNTSADITLNYQFRGVSWTGFITINGLSNTLKGTLHDPIVGLINTATSAVETTLNNELATIRGTLDNDEATFEAILPRVSPYRSEQIREPDINAYFGDSTGSDTFPTNLTPLTQVNPDNPVFVVTGTDAFIYVDTMLTYELVNNTSGLVTPLSSSEAGTNPNLDLGISISANGRVYFGYRMSGLTASDELEVFSFTLANVVAWQEDIDQLEHDVTELQHIVENPILNIPDDVAGVLEHDITVTDDSGAVATATVYNRSLSGDGTIAVLNQDPATSAPVAGYTQTNPFSASPANSRGQKLIIIQNHNYTLPLNVLRADDGTGTKQNLVDISLSGVVTVKTFIPASGGGTQVVTVYPLPALQARQDWYTIPGHTSNNIAEDSELFFTRNVPTTATTLNIRLRYLVNGNGGATVSATLANVGGGADVDTIVTLNLPDGETITVNIGWLAAQNSIRVQTSPNAINPNFFTYDTQVGLDYQETRVIPPSPATTKDVALGTYNALTPLVFIARPSVARVTGSTDPKLIIVSNLGEINTNFDYNDLFSATDVGFIEANSTTATIYNWLNFIPSEALLTIFAQRATLPYNGFFSDNHTFETVVNFDTQLTARNAAGDTVNLGQQLILIAPDTSRYALSVDNDGALVTTKVN